MWKQLGHWNRRTIDFHEEFWSTVLPQQLSTASTRRNWLVVAKRAYGNKAPTTRPREFTDHSTLCTKCESVRRIFHVAPSDDATIGSETCRTDPKLGIRDVCKLHGIPCRLSKCIPVDVVHCRQR